MEILRASYVSTPLPITKGCSYQCVLFIHKWAVPGRDGTNEHAENDALQKQLLFAPPRKKEVSHWKRLANDYKIDETQLRRTLFDKKAVNELLQATHGER